MKVVGIVGGPKHDGNTFKLVRAVLDGALEAGHTTVLWRLKDIYIGHLGYFADEMLPPNDDFEKMQADLESMGAMVIGAPIWLVRWIPGHSTGSTEPMSTISITARRTP